MSTTGRLSTAEAAALLEITPAGFRSIMAKARAQGVDLRVPGPDSRTPLWDATGLQAWHASRPGRGNWGGS